MMIQCLIVDDEPLAQKVMEKYISQSPELALVATCLNAKEVFAALHQHTIDLIFLDIKMPSISGIDFIRSLKTPPAIIFTTAFAEHALLSYELQAVDYLLKPITYKRFRKSIDRFVGQQPVAPKEEAKPYFYIKVNGSLIKLFFKDVLYAQSLKDYIRVVTVHGHYITHLTMGALLELLPPDAFRRVHRSYIVNTEAIDVLHKKTVVIAGQEIPIGDRFKN